MGNSITLDARSFDTPSFSAPRSLILGAVSGGVDTVPPTVIANIEPEGGALTLTFDEAVTGVDATDFALSGGHNLSNSGGNGTSWTFGISPPVLASETVTLDYTGTAVVDASSNPMDTFTGQAVENDSTLDVPSAPTFTVDQLEEGSTGNMLSWSDTDSGASEVDQFRVWRSLNGGTYAIVHTTADETETSWLDTGTTEGDSLAYKIQAHNAQGWSDFSDEQTGTSQGPGIPGTRSTSQQIALMGAG